MLTKKKLKIKWGIINRESQGDAAGKSPLVLIASYQHYGSPWCLAMTSRGFLAREICKHLLAQGHFAATMVTFWSDELARSVTSHIPHSADRSMWIPPTLYKSKRRVTSVAPAPLLCLDYATFTFPLLCHPVLVQSHLWGFLLPHSHQEWNWSSFYSWLPHSFGISAWKTKVTI